MLIAKRYWVIDLIEERSRRALMAGRFEEVRRRRRVLGPLRARQALADPLCVEPLSGG